MHAPILIVACLLMTSGERGFSLVTSYKEEGSGDSHIHVQIIILQVMHS